MSSCTKINLTQVKHLNTRAKTETAKSKHGQSNEAIGTGKDFLDNPRNNNTNQ